MRLVIIFLLLSLSSMASEKLKVYVSPSTPVKGESFNLIFEIDTDSDAEPFVSFSPNGLEVLGRNREVSLRTSIINGKFTSSRTIKMVYDVVADRARTIMVNDISVKLNGDEIKHKPIRIQVLSKRKEPNEIFLKVETSKDKVFIGEGVDVRYYLYYRVPVVQTEFKSFPKLNGFIKRFHKVDDREEAVEYEGRAYRRSLKYSARVYPEKTGDLKIDPLRLNIQYAGGSGNPFGTFGLSFKRFKRKGVNSENHVITVKPLPVENIPLNFTGLVGKHEFSYSVNKEKFVVNEAIEGRLEVVGPGALEKMDAPVIYRDPSLEKFDTKSDFFEIGLDRGRKVFNYTLLARADSTLPERILSLAYFDPDEERYIDFKLTIPKLEIGGGSLEIQSSGPSPNEIVPKNEEIVNSKLKSNFSINSPLFSESWNSIPIRWPRYLIYLLLTVILFQVLEMLLSYLRKNNTASGLDVVIHSMKKNGITYSGLAKLLLDKRVNRISEGVDLRIRIDTLGLSKSDKKYFLDTLNTLEKETFSSSKERKRKIRFRKKSFKSLKNELSNENRQ